jgi:hypothetical protein
VSNHPHRIRVSDKQISPTHKSLNIKQSAVQNLDCWPKKKKKKKKKKKMMMMMMMMKIVKEKTEREENL